jgi:hypothetical protein
VVPVAVGVFVNMTDARLGYGVITLGFGLLALFGSAGVGLFALTIHGLVTRQVRWLKWPFMLFVCAALILGGLENVTQFLGITNTIVLRVENASGVELRSVAIFGRGESVTIGPLVPGSYDIVRYAGRAIQYGRRNEFENRVNVRWHDGERARERVVVGTYAVLRDSLSITFRGVDSLEVRPPFLSAGSGAVQ